MVGPSSIRSSTTSATQFDHPFGPHITITRKDLSSSTLAYQRLLSASKSYTNSTLSLANSSSELASALDECSRLKGSHESSSQLQALSGLYYLISSYNQVLADSFWKDFSIPLLNHFDVYNAANFERSLTNEKLLAEKSKVLKDTEMRNLKNGRKKERDLNSFRKALNELQEQVEEIDRLKSDYYHELLQSEEECWKLVMEKVALLTRSHLDISERLTSKGSSDPILEPLLSSIPDPFNSYGPERTEDQIFSILQTGNGIGSNFLSSDDRDRGGLGLGGEMSPSGMGIMSPSTPIVGLPRSASGKEKEKEKEREEAKDGLGINSDEALNEGDETVIEDEEEERPSSALFDEEELDQSLEKNGPDDLLGPSVSRKKVSHAVNNLNPTSNTSSKKKNKDKSNNSSNLKEDQDQRHGKVLSIIDEGPTSNASLASSIPLPKSEILSKSDDQPVEDLEEKKKKEKEEIINSNPSSKFREHQKELSHNLDHDEEAELSNDESVRGEKVNGSENGIGTSND